MKKRRIFSLLLALCLVCTLLPLRASAAGVIEVHSLDELTRALADTPAKPMGARGDGKAPVRVLVLEPELPDTCGAQRVLHDTETGEYLLEFGSRADAEAAYETLTQTHGLTRCWLDTPEQGAHVLSGASVMQANSWGENTMQLTSYRTDAHVRAHFNAEATYCVGCGACAHVCPQGALEMEPFDMRDLVVVDEQSQADREEQKRQKEQLDKLREQARKRLTQVANVLEKLDDE